MNNSHIVLLNAAHFTLLCNLWKKWTYTVNGSRRSEWCYHNKQRSYQFCKKLCKKFSGKCTSVTAVKAKTQHKPYSSSSYSNESITAKSTTNDINEHTDSEEIISGSCGSNVMYSLNKSSGELVISGSGNMNNFQYSPWYNQKDCITSVDIKNGVTSIGECAFQQHKKLVSINIPNEVDYIGKNAFDSCSELMSIKLPIGITSINDKTFYSCKI